MRKVYPLYGAFVFVFFFLLLYPFMFIFVQFKSCRNINHWLYRIWGYLVFFFTGLRWNVIRHFKTEKGKVYIYCSNHTSYSDIPALYCTILQDMSFIGKSSLRSVPLFGYIYSRIHILVDRRSRDSKLDTMVRSKEALDHGISMVIFPEGTIPKVGEKRQMIDFKDGAFKIAIEKGVPIVPVTMPYNYIILPDDDKMKARPHECKVIFHEPIETKDLTLKDAPVLKQRVYDIISEELSKH